MEGQKRRRLQGSCDSCRSRKIGCDSAQRPGAKCSNCQSFGTECTHLAAKSRKNGPLPQHSANWGTREDIQVHIAAILSTTTPYMVPDARVTRPLLVELARYARGLEAKVAALEQRISQSPPSLAPSPFTDHPEVQTMEEPMEQLSLADHANLHYGATDEAKFVKTAADLVKKNEPWNRRPEYWTKQFWQTVPVLIPPPLYFPPPDLLDSLVATFLERFNPFICLIHGPSFKRDIAHGAHFTSREFGSVVLAVCALASRMSADMRISPGIKAGWEWFQQLRPIDPVAYKSPGCLWDLQLIPLMVMYMHGLIITDQSWLYIGLGIRIAQDMGVHRKRRRDGCEWTPLDESLKRAWWALIAVDMYASTLFSRPRAANSDEFDADYPLEVDDECWPDEFLADPTRPWTQPAGVPSKVTAWVLHLKLFEIFGFAQKTIYTVKRSELWESISAPGWGRNVTIELDSALNKWFDSIPDHLRWDPHIPTEASACLYTTYYWVQIQIHRPFIRANRSFPSVAICTNAARSCSHVFTAHHRAFGTIPMTNMFTAALHATITLLLVISDGALASPRDLEDVHMMLDMMKMHEERWMVAGRFCDFIRGILMVLKVPEASDVRANMMKRKPDANVERDNIDWNTILDWNGIDIDWESWNPNVGQAFGTYLGGLDEIPSGIIDSESVQDSNGDVL